MKNEKLCNNCPRMCRVDRSVEKGFCGSEFVFEIAKIMKHFGEEPVITGTNGSGTIFFSGCVLKCPFCQNYPISHEHKGQIYTAEQLEYEIFSLEQQGVHNINLVSPTQFLHMLVPVLEKCKARLSIPIVYNTGGYERPEMIERLSGLVDIYLPDLKYFDNSYGVKYSKAENYFDYTSKSIQEMLRQQPECVIKDGIMQKGVIVRHLVLPTLYKDSIKLMEWIASLENKPLVSVMRQYTPCYDSDKYKELTRRITTFEYEKVTDRCAELGLEGFTQLKGCETLDMTPDF